MKTTLLTVILLGTVCGAGAQFGQARLDALEEAGIAEGGAAGDTGETRGGDSDARQLAEAYASQRGRDMDTMLSEILRVAGAASRKEDPLGAPMGVPLREPVNQDLADEGADGEGRGMQRQDAAEGFLTAAKGLDIRGVNPGRSEFLSGSDNIFEGDVVDISGAGGIFRVWIVDVEEDGIVVMDDKTKRTEKISLSIGTQNLIPQGWGANGKVGDAPPF